MVKTYLTRHFFILFVLVLKWTICEGQYEVSNWCFGESAGIRFSNGSVTIFDSKIEAREGCATISSKKGELLFYTNGQTVWDSTGNVMLNGTNLNGHFSSTQSSVIVPWPDSIHLFIIVTNDFESSQNGVQYSVVNMRLNHGKGDVLPRMKNIPLANNLCEKLVAAIHSNGKDYWLIAAKYGSDSILSYRIDNQGINKIPVISETGYPIQKTKAKETSIGYMKVSPNGRFIAYANYNLGFSNFGKFNNITGKITEVWRLKIDEGYGVEFSPNSTYLYISERKTKRIYQYKTYAITEKEMDTGTFVITGNWIDGPAAMQLGPDNQIYIAEFGSNYLSVLNNPNVIGHSVKLKNQYLYLNGKLSSFGLPNFSQHFFNPTRINISNLCLGDSTSFRVFDKGIWDSIYWNLGDSIKVKYIEGNTMHLYQKPGAFQIKCLKFINGFCDTITDTIWIRKSTVFIGNDTIVCNKDRALLYLSVNNNYYSYLWNSAQKTQSITIDKPGTYYLTTVDSMGCYAFDTINIYNPRILPKIEISLINTCEMYNKILIKNSTQFLNDQRHEATISFGDQTFSQDTVAVKRYKRYGKYQIKLIEKSKLGCWDSVAKTVWIDPNPVSSFLTNNLNQCLNDNYFTFTNNSSIASGRIIQMKFISDDSLLGDTFIKYLKIGEHRIINIVTSDSGCSDTSIQYVNVRPNPTAIFTLTDNKDQVNRKILFTNLSIGAINSSWSFGDGSNSIQFEPYHYYIPDTSKKNIKLVVQNEFGCIDSMTQVLYPLLHYYIPNSFSPNNDGINDELLPIISPYLIGYKLEIYNRWGEKLFESLDPSIGWNGIYRGALCPTGSYLCTVWIKYISGDYAQSSQGVLLIR